MTPILAYIKQNANESLISALIALVLVIFTFNFQIYNGTKGFPLPNMFYITEGLFAGNYIWAFPITIINYLFYVVLFFFLLKIFLSGKRLSD